MAVQILSSGLLTTIQDEGRTGHEAYGVPRSGAFDPFLAAVANRLVGNARSAAVLEFAVIAPQLKFDEPCCLAISGFDCSFRLDNEPVRCFSSFKVSGGSVLKFEAMTGWFGYIAISGGIQSDQVLGSRSTYLPGRIGRRLAAGDSITIGKQNADSLLSIDPAFIRPPLEIPLLPALHTELFSVHERRKIVEREYRITSQSNRMGMRLQGNAIDTRVIRRSCPVISGTLQIPPGGHPIILGPDGPTTGGYAQLGVIARAGWTTLAASQPGKTLKFEWATKESAIAAWQKREEIFNSEDVWQRA